MAGLLTFWLAGWLLSPSRPPATPVSRRSRWLAGLPFSLLTLPVPVSTVPLSYPDKLQWEVDRTGGPRRTKPPGGIEVLPLEGQRD